jgi:putative DNA primase/helicase
MNSSIHEVIGEFTRAMLAAGIETDARIEADGRLHRIQVTGQRRGTKNAAYILHADGCPAGWYQDFVSGITGTWSLGGGHWEIDQATKAKIEADRKQRQLEREQLQAKKAAEACRIWNSAMPCTVHDYLGRKDVESHGLRSGTWHKRIETEAGWHSITIENTLLVPVVSPDNNLVNVQAIFAEPHPELGRDKDFISGARKKGCFYWIGESTDTILICEGYATGASLHEHTGHMVVIAFDCGNLMDVAVTVRKAKPDAAIIIAGDNDRKTPGNPGLTKAREAALAIGGKLLIPQFDHGESGSDWNDWITNRRFSGSPKKLNLSISPLEAFTGREAQHGA